MPSNTTTPSNLEHQVEKAYQELKCSNHNSIKATYSTYSSYSCPFCTKKPPYQFRTLLHHATGIGAAVARNADIRANHLALSRYLRHDFVDEVAQLLQDSKDGKHQLIVDDEFEAKKKKLEEETILQAQQASRFAALQEKLLTKDEKTKEVKGSTSAAETTTKSPEKLATKRAADITELTEENKRKKVKVSIDSILGSAILGEQSESQDQSPVTVSPGEAPPISEGKDVLSEDVNPTALPPSVSGALSAPSSQLLLELLNGQKGFEHKFRQAMPAALAANVINANFKAGTANDFNTFLYHHYAAMILGGDALAQVASLETENTNLSGAAEKDIVSKDVNPTALPPSVSGAPSALSSQFLSELLNGQKGFEHKFRQAMPAALAANVTNADFKVGTANDFSTFLYHHYAAMILGGDALAQVASLETENTNLKDRNTVLRGELIKLEETDRDLYDWLAKATTEKLKSETELAKLRREKAEWEGEIIRAKESMVVALAEAKEEAVEAYKAGEGAQEIARIKAEESKLTAAMYVEAMEQTLFIARRDYGYTGPGPKAYPNGLNDAGYIAHISVDVAANAKPVVQEPAVARDRVKKSERSLGWFY